MSTENVFNLICNDVYRNKKVPLAVELTRAFLLTRLTTKKEKSAQWIREQIHDFNNIKYLRFYVPLQQRSSKCDTW